MAGQVGQLLGHHLRVGRGHLVECLVEPDGAAPRRRHQEVGDVADRTDQRGQQLEVALGYPAIGAITHPVAPGPMQLPARSSGAERTQAGDRLPQRRDREPYPAQIDRRDMQMDHTGLSL